MTVENALLILKEKYFKIDEEYELEIQKLPGDASSREYHRITYQDHNFLLCLNDPSNTKQNEEFIYWTNQYSNKGIRVPEVFYFELGIVLQEDFGDLSLLRMTRDSSKDVERLYLKAIDEVIKIHNLNIDKSKNYDQFDEKKLNFEVGLTLEYFVKKMNKVSDEEVSNIKSLFKPVLEKFKGLKYVISHRDYHSKNIIIKDGEACIIDYQDSMLGPRQYDLCSLIDDRYTSLPENLKESLLNYYFDKTEVQESKEEFLLNYDYVMIQRIFKAIGSFSYHYIKNGNISYLPFINSSIESLITTLDKIPELGKLKNSLYSYRYDG